MAKRKVNMSLPPLPPRLNKILTRIGAIFLLAFILLLVRIFLVGNHVDYSQMSEESASALKVQDSFWDHINKKKAGKLGGSYYNGLGEVPCKSIEINYKYKLNDEKYALYDEYGVNKVEYFQYPWNATSRVDKNSDNDSFEIWIDLDNKSEDYHTYDSEIIKFKVSKINFAILKVDDLSGKNGGEFWLTDEQQHELMNFAIDQFKEYQKEYFKVNK